MKFRCTRLGGLALLGVFVVATALAAPLHDAARSGNVGAVKRLIQKGANVDAENNYGLTPLLVAIGNGHSDIVQVLRRNGAKTIITPEVLARIQTYLKTMGYDPGGIDGLLGSGTRNAIRAYQAQQGMEADGRLSEDWIVQLNQDILRTIQTRLKLLGYDPGSVDGLVGPSTRTAIRAFQEKEGLPVTVEITGDWFDRLLAMTADSAGAELNTASAVQTEAKEATIAAPAQTEPEPQTAASTTEARIDVDLTAIQNRLKALGYYRGKADGVMGPGTERAIRAFQAKQGLPVTGAVLRDWMLKMDYEILRKVQDQLRALGYADSEITVQLAPPAQQASRAVREQQGLPVSDESHGDRVAQLQSGLTMESIFTTVETETPDKSPSELIELWRGQNPENIDVGLVKTLQTRLTSLGFDTGPADGYLGRTTRDAIRDFQKKTGLPVTGEVSEDWLLALDIQRLRTIQARLRTLDYDPGPVDGKLGARTRTAIGSFQKKTGLLVDNAVSDDLLAKLQEAIATKAVAEAAASAEQLSQIQHRLRALGFDPGPVDGELGPGTQTAIRAFQKQAGLKVDGAVSRALIRELDSDIVRSAQARLQLLGYDVGPVDGEMGSTTRDAIRKFQKRTGLATTGEASAELVVKLAQTIAAKAAEEKEKARIAAEQRAKAQAASLQHVRAVQTRLDALGYNPGPVDGEMGKRTRSAIREFQRQTKLAVTGEASEALVARLEDALNAAAAARARAAREQQRLAAEREQQAAQTEAQRAAAEREQQAAQAQVRAEEQARLAAETASAAEAQRVSSIQAQLKELGYKVSAVDGQLGTQTQAAIRAFQVRVGLRATGEPSDALMAKLEDTIASQAQAQVERDIQALQHPSARVSRNKLLKIQGFLRVLGHDPGRADGRLGARTQGAIRAFQAQAGLPVTGEATEELYAILEKLASSKTSAAKVLNNSGQRSEVNGEMRFQRSAGGDLIGCSVQNVQLDISWCNTFVSRSNTENCKVVLRPNAKVLFVKCV